MKNYWIYFRLHVHTSVEDAWEQLTDKGLTVLYSEEDPDTEEMILVCVSPQEDVTQEWLSQFPFIVSYTKIEAPAIDWESQWSLHGQNYEGGYIHLKIPDMEKEIKLLPGPGFGDLSHPTTRLVIELMPAIVKGKEIVDIGCGSGILAVAAVGMGAAKVYAIDIDPAAIEHTESNVKLNGWEDVVWIGQNEALLKLPLNDELVGLMNMISSEQTEAWRSLRFIRSKFQTLIVSGILEEELTDEETRWRTDGWQVVHHAIQDGWCALLLGRT